MEHVSSSAINWRKKWTILWMAYAMNIWPRTKNQFEWVLEKKDYQVQRFRYLWTWWVIGRCLVAHHTTYLLGESMPVTSSSFSVLHHTPNTTRDLTKPTGTLMAPYVSDYLERLRFSLKPVLIGTSNRQKYSLVLHSYEEAKHLGIFGKNSTSSLYNIIINLTMNVYADMVIVSWTGCEFSGCKSISTNKLMASQLEPHNFYWKSN